jgi:hypothetical protein
MALMTSAASSNVGAGVATTRAEPIAPRKWPFPYRAALAVCSDLDETLDREVYFETLRFLNTRERTAMGEGLGLEVGNTLYFDMPPEQFAYWNTDDQGRAQARDCIRSGHIDCFHSFGDLATTRGHAARALEELARHDCHIGVWIDHGTAITNFGGDIMAGMGDVPNAEAYHADLTCDYGVRYVWRGRVTSVIGQDVDRKVSGIFNSRHPLASGRTLAKEVAKGLLARAGSDKYGLHASNVLMRPARLRDGREVIEFLRANPHWGGVSSCETGLGIGDVLTDALLERLARRGGACLLYTHLGKLGPGGRRFPESAIAGFRRLARAHAQGRILVATTRRLLDFCRHRDELRCRQARVGEELHIDVSGHAPMQALAGLTFHCADPTRTRLSVNGREVAQLQYNAPDDTGRASVSIPWTRLTYPST